MSKTDTVAAVRQSQAEVLLEYVAAGICTATELVKVMCVSKSRISRLAAQLLNEKRLVRRGRVYSLPTPEKLRPNVAPRNPSQTALVNEAQASSGQNSKVDEGKLDHDQVSSNSNTEFEVTMMPISKVFPSRVNGKVYRPVSRSDPTLRNLANSIRTRGVLEPLVITKEGDILSGHRRHTAAKLAGLTEIPCRVKNISHNDPEFLSELVAYNKQRVKSRDELLREAVISIKPEEAHGRLIAHRLDRSRLAEKNSPALHAIQLRREKLRSRISRAKTPLLEAIQRICEEHRSYWPLTDRRVHYQLLNIRPLRHAAKPDSVYGNNKESYRAAIDLLTRGRLEGLIQWGALSDETRPVIVWDAHRSPQTFLDRELKNFLRGYWRELLQSQPNHIEIVGEKNTIEGIIRPIAERYTIPFTIGRGYCSLDPRRQLVERFSRSGKEKLVLLMLSDFDPDGEEIGHSFARSLRDDFWIKESQIQAIKVGLTRTQVDELGLPPNMLAKPSSSNYNRFLGQHGRHAYELEAVDPGTLQQMLERAIQSVIDHDAFNAEIEAEKADAAFLETQRAAILTMLRKRGQAEQE
jgi:ParB/RepB/Spo0J family partition protein